MGTQKLSWRRVFFWGGLKGLHQFFKFNLCYKISKIKNILIININLSFSKKTLFQKMLKDFSLYISPPLQTPKQSLCEVGASLRTLSVAWQPFFVAANITVVTPHIYGNFSICFAKLPGPGYIFYGFAYLIAMDFIGIARWNDNFISSESRDVA